MGNATNCKDFEQGLMASVSVELLKDRRRANENIASKSEVSTCLKYFRNGKDNGGDAFGDGLECEALIPMVEGSCTV